MRDKVGKNGHVNHTYLPWQVSIAKGFQKGVGGWGKKKGEEGCREGPPSPPLPSYAGLTQKELITHGWPKMR